MVFIHVVKFYKILLKLFFLISIQASTTNFSNRSIVSPLIFLPPQDHLKTITNKWYKSDQLSLSLQFFV